MSARLPRLGPLLFAGALAVGLASTAARAAEATARGEGTAAPPVSAEATRQAAELEARLLAPCCWNGTLDVHSSPLASELRSEIRTRVAGGESIDAIEADVVRRYGARIVAVPAENHLSELAGVAGAVVVVAGAGALLTVVRWRRRGARARVGGGAPAREPETRAVSPEKSDLDRRLDDELERDAPGGDDEA